MKTTEAVADSAMELNPRGVTRDDVVATVGRMRQGQSLYIETRFSGGNGRLFVVGADERTLDAELCQRTQTSGRWFLLFRM